LTKRPSVPVQLNLPEGYCIPIFPGGIITPVRHEAGEDPDILLNGFIIIPVYLIANINGKTFHTNSNHN